jgi:GDP-4-dehydro-6-deoxy-D-mannose reductase
MRPADIPLIFGDNSKLRAHTGWSPQIPLRRTLQDVFRQAQMSAT